MYKLYTIIFAVYILIILIAFLKRKNFFTSKNQEDRKGQKDPYEEKFFLYMFSLILFVVLVLRIVNLNSNSYWLDELISVTLSSNASIDTVLKGCMDDIHPPLYQILLFYYIKFGGDSELSTRLLSVFFGLISSVVTFLIAKRMFGVKKSMEIFLLFAVAYFPVYYSQESRSYGLLLLLTLTVNYFFLKSFIAEDKSLPETDSWKLRNVILYIIFSILLLLTHYYGVLVLVMNALFLVFYISLTCKFKESIRQYLKSGLIFAVILGIFYLLWGQVFLDHIERGAGYEKQKPGGNIFTAFVYYVLNPNLATSLIKNNVLYLFEICLIAGTLYLFFLIFKKRSRNENIDQKYFYYAFLFFWLFAPFTISFLNSVYSDSSISFRNLIISTPAVIFLVYLTSEKVVLISLTALTKFIKPLADKFTNFRAVFINYSFLFALIVSSLLFMKVYYYYSAPSKHDVRGAVKTISAESVNFYKDPIIFSSSDGTDRFNYYFEKTDPKLRVTAFLPPDNYLNVLSEYKTEIENHKYMILLDVPGWDDNSQVVVDYFKNNFKLISHRDHLGINSYVFSLGD